jgi:hypothetical protein
MKISVTLLLEFVLRGHWNGALLLVICACDLLPNPTKVMMALFRLEILCWWWKNPRKSHFSTSALHWPTAMIRTKYHNSNQWHDGPTLSIWNFYLFQISSFEVTKSFIIPSVRQLTKKILPILVVLTISLLLAFFAWLEWDLNWMNQIDG